MSRANIKIIVDDVFNLDYESAESLGITFNRIVEDFTDLSKRFGEFSYTFSLPKTKNNSLAFEFPDVKGRRGVFVGTQKTCKVFNNSTLLLDGIVELRGLNNDVFQCVFFSKFSELLEFIKGEDNDQKSLKDIISLGTITDFTYELDMRNHLNAQLSPDETKYQFPLTYYSTLFTPSSLLDNASPDFNGNPFIIPDNFLQNWYYLFSSDGATATNSLFSHQLPLAIYVVPVLEAMLQDAGWSLGGSFFQREDINKIIMMYTGDNDVYDQAIGCPDDDIPLDACSGTTNNIWLAAFLPEIDQTEFLKGLLNTFNLYFTLDVDNKIINFETWDVLFGDEYNPYDITDKVFQDTVTFSRIDNYDPSIKFQDNTNMRVLGDNKVMTNNAADASGVIYSGTSSNYTKEVFNKIGSTDEIEVPFGLPNVGRKYLRQDFDISGTNRNAGDFQIFVPILSTQTTENNDTKPFYRRDTDTSLNNDESTIKYDGQPTLMWYYGQSESDLEKEAGFPNSDFYYFRIGLSERTKIGFANPFTLVQGSAFDRVNEYLGSSPTVKNKDTAETSYLKALHYNIGKQDGNVPNVPNFSLTFGADDTYHKTIYTEFHKKKYDLYFNSELLTAEMRMNEFDWNEMQINRCIKYNDELYSIISIENYDVVLNVASITLIKK